MFNDSGSVAVQSPVLGATFSADPICLHNSVVAEIPFPKLAPGSPDPHVRVQADFGFEIAFEQGSVGPVGVYPVKETLQKIVSTVHRVISHFDTLIREPRWARP